MTDDLQRERDVLELTGEAFQQARRRRRRRRRLALRRRLLALIGWW